MQKEKEITFELTDYCNHHCKYCSSNSIDNIKKATFLEFRRIGELLDGKFYERIILSGGEPLSHPNFFNIALLCKEHSNDVIVYTNLLTHVIFNVNVIEDIIVEANLTVQDNVRRIHVLKRVEQGREKERPDVHFSRNWTQDCDCDKIVVIPDGSIVKSPCRKEEYIYESGDK